MQGTASFKSPLSVLVTGTSLFLRRHGHIFQALAPHFAHLDYLPARGISHFHRAVYKLGSILCQRAPRRVNSALRTARRDASMGRACFCRAVAAVGIADCQSSQCPLTLSFTSSACIVRFGRGRAFRTRCSLTIRRPWRNRNWRDWAPFASESSLRARLLCERRAYHNAVHLFPFENGTRQSLIEDYGVDPARNHRQSEAP